MAYGGADLSTYDPNPSMDDFAYTQSGTDWSALINTVGQWGATIASVATGNPTANVPVQGGGYQTVGVAGSGVVAKQNSQLLILVLIGVVVIVLVTRK